MVQWIAQPIFEDERSFEHSFTKPIDRGEHVCACNLFLENLAPPRVVCMCAYYVCRPGNGCHSRREEADGPGAVHPARPHRTFHPPQGTCCRVVTIPSCHDRVIRRLVLLCCLMRLLSACRALRFWSSPCPRRRCASSSYVGGEVSCLHVS
jgi:hypothetical protein